MNMDKKDMGTGSFPAVEKVSPFSLPTSSHVSVSSLVRMTIKGCGTSQRTDVGQYSTPGTGVRHNMKSDSTYLETVTLLVSDRSHTLGWTPSLHGEGVTVCMDRSRVGTNYSDDNVEICYI